MRVKNTHLLNFICSLLPAFCLLGNPLQADELSELYFNSSENDSGSEIGPNILIALDTSGSMTDNDTPFTVDPQQYWVQPYDPLAIYPGSCDRNTVYRKKFEGGDRNGDGAINDLDAIMKEDFQSCTSPFRFPKSVMACVRIHQNGFVLDHIGEYWPETPGPNGNGTFGSEELDGKWHSMNSNFNDVDDIDGFEVWRECASDVGTHGRLGIYSGTYRWPTNDLPAPGYGILAGWTNSTANDASLDSKDIYVVATGNYLNYFHWAQTRLAAVQTALRDVITHLPASTHVGVMRFDVKIPDEDSSDGGYMIHEFVELGENILNADGSITLSANRQSLIDRIFAIEPAGHGGTPLGETLFEAMQVYRGGDVVFGLSPQRWRIDRSVFPWQDSALNGALDDNTDGFVSDESVVESRTSDSFQYISPIQFQCQKNAVILLSDGDADGDTGTDDSFRHVPGAIYAPYYGYTCGGCLEQVADYMAHEDLRPPESGQPLAGDQTVTTYTVGFGSSISAAGTTVLTNTARNGGGTYTHANSYEELKNAFEVIFREEIAENASLSSPAVTVNAFNRLTHEDNLYFTVFDPILDSVNWPGNVKKYKLKKQDDGEYRIVDANLAPALVDDSSAIRYDALSYWTNTSDPDVVAYGGVDGDQTLLGGVAGELRDAGSREIFTWLGGSRALTATENHFAPSTTGITNEMLGLDAAADATTRNNVIQYMRGMDLRDENEDGSTTDTRKHLGAAPHGVPAIVTYGTDAASASQVIYAPTNDGFLHAIDASTGEELWAFVPTEAMGNYADIYQVPDDTFIGYGLDGSIVPHTEKIGGVDRKWIFFGMRRGGRTLYALDVTNKLAPEVLWRIRGGETTGFEHLAQTWSEPRVARINVSGQTTSVLIFGGGYDASVQDSAPADTGYVDDSIGQGVYVVKAENGDLLWRAGPSGSAADLQLAGMKSSIPASVEIKDKNEDGLHDLIYAADVGGRIFRFDINESSGPLDITGGMIASLGAESGSATLENNRKFFNEPDVVLVASNDVAYWAINIGSGDRERPKSNRTTQDYLFSIKDPNVFVAPASYGYGITIDDLYDATANDVQQGTDRAAARTTLDASNGWKVSLAYAGEKALAPAKTFDFRVFFTTFDPIPLDDSDCNSDPGTARLYTLDLITAGAVGDSNDDGVTDRDDRSTTLTHGTVPPAITFMFIEDTETGDVDITNVIGRTDDKANTGKKGAVRRTSWNVESNEDKEQ